MHETGRLRRGRGSRRKRKKSKHKQKLPKRSTGTSALLMAAQTEISMEECALGMAQKSNYKEETM